MILIATTFRQSLSDNQLQPPSFASKHWTIVLALSDLMSVALGKREFEIDQIVQKHSCKVKTDEKLIHGFQYFATKRCQN